MLPDGSSYTLARQGTSKTGTSKTGTSKTGTSKIGTNKTREVELATIWSAEGHERDGTPERDPGSVSYSAAIESAAQRDTEEVPSEFASRVQREATRRGFDTAARRVVLGDGAKWIWNLADQHFPDAIQIVDRFHATAKQHLSDVGEAICGATSDLAKEWARDRHEQLDAGQIDALLVALRTHAQASEEARNCSKYIEKNRQRMRHPEFRAAGLCTSTRVVEAGCKVAIGTRCKRTGTHWTVAGVDAIMVRTLFIGVYPGLSERMRDFVADRVDRFFAQL